MPQPSPRQSRGRHRAVAPPTGAGARQKRPGDPGGRGRLARAEKDAGDWGGLFFASNTSDRSLVTASTIAYGGMSYSGTLVGNLVLDGARGTYTNNLIVAPVSVGLRQHDSAAAVVAGNMFARNPVNWSVSP